MTGISWRTVGWVVVAVITGCATHVSLTGTRREEVRAQAAVVAIAARDLDQTVRGRTLEPAEEPAAEAIGRFHAAAEDFAGATSRWLDDDTVSTRYETLIRAWVEVRKTFPNLRSDRLLDESYRRVAVEWDKLHRAAGGAGRHLERSLAAAER